MQTGIRLITLSLMVLILQACAPHSDGQQRLAMRNPASVWCLQRSGELIQSSAQGDSDSTHYCLLPDGERVEQWALFHRDHPQ